MDLSKVYEAQGVDLIHVYLAQKAFGAKLVTAQGHGYCHLDEVLQSFVVWAKDIDNALLVGYLCSIL